jgi:putative SOS response-associated peptidase YedK
MCGRISLYSDPDYLARIFDAQLGLDIDTDARPSWNVPPTRTILAVADVPDATGTGDADAPPACFHRELGRYKWGLVPSWANDPSVGSRMFNARAETVATKPSFRAALAARRLVVVADGFYEWKPSTEGPKRPYYFTRADGRPMALAGLWEQWWGGPGVRARSDSDQVALRTCTVVTTEAGPDMGDVHHRMPVVLEDDVLDEWLDPENQDKPELESLLVPSPAGTLVSRAVGRSVGNVRNDGPELTEAADD